MIWQMIEDWFRGILTDGILSNLSGLFDSVNTEVGEIATQVGTTPAGWNAGIFNMIRSLSENVIVPIAGVIITFVMCYELIQLVIEKNNLHDLDTWIFFKWIFKTFVAVLLVTNTWNIVMGVFDVTQSVVNQSAGVIISDTSIDVTTVITDIEAKLDAMSVGGLLGLWFQSLFVGLTMKALSICIMLAIAAEQPQRDNPLKHVEDIVEQNDNNFDGIINNTPQAPTVADLEQRAKAGEAISVTDLAKAVKAEKREQPQKKPSILKKLDEYKKQAAQQPKDKQKEQKKDLEV